MGQIFRNNNCASDRETSQGIIRFPYLAIEHYPAISQEIQQKFMLGNLLIGRRWKRIRLDEDNEQPQNVHVLFIQFEVLSRAKLSQPDLHIILYYVLTFPSSKENYFKTWTCQVKLCLILLAGGAEEDLRDWILYGLSCSRFLRGSWSGNLGETVKDNRQNSC